MTIRNPSWKILSILHPTSHYLKLLAKIMQKRPRNLNFLYNITYCVWDFFSFFRNGWIFLLENSCIVSFALALLLFLFRRHYKMTLANIAPMPIYCLYIRKLPVQHWFFWKIQCVFANFSLNLCDEGRQFSFDDVT